jgi:hypothetical protein
MFTGWVVFVIETVNKIESEAENIVMSILSRTRSLGVKRFQMLYRAKTWITLEFNIAHFLASPSSIAISNYTNLELEMSASRLSENIQL